MEDQTNIEVSGQACRQDVDGFTPPSMQTQTRKSSLKKLLTGRPLKWILIALITTMMFVWLVVLSVKISLLEEQSPLTIVPEENLTVVPLDLLRNLSAIWNITTPTPDHWSYHVPQEITDST